jgi:hypothetical protein
MPVIPLDEAQPGDLVFCDSVGFVGRAIRFVTRGKYNHSAWLDRHVAGVPFTPEVGWFVGQAVGRGVTVDARLDTIAPGGSYVIVRAPEGTNRETELAWLRSQVGRRYGFLTIASILVTLFTPKFVNVMLPDTWICSAVVGEGLAHGGWCRSWPDIYQVIPQQLFDAAA